MPPSGDNHAAGCGRPLVSDEPGISASVKATGVIIGIKGKSAQASDGSALEDARLLEASPLAAANIPRAVRPCIYCLINSAVTNGTRPEPSRRNSGSIHDEDATCLIGFTAMQYLSPANPKELRRHE